MPVIPVYTTDENDIPLNDLELYINDVLVDGDFDYGESYDFPCGNPFKINLRRKLWFGADETICHNNPIVSNNDITQIVSGITTPPTCLFPPDPHAPNSFIIVNVNGNIYNQSYNYYTPSVNTMLNDMAVLINNDTPTTFWEAIVQGDCLRIRKTQYTANTYNGQVFSISIHREFSPTFIVTDLGTTGNQTGDPCDPLNPIDYDEHLWQLTWREVHQDFTQTLIVDTDTEIPFEFENSLIFPCCDNWSVANNDNDGILEAGEYNPMFIILATPAFEGAISNFYLVKYPCDNMVCAYEMTNIPYCHYEYNFNVTPNEKENIIQTGRNTCYDYKCADIYTIGLTVWRCSEEARNYLEHCGCGIREVENYTFITDVSYQQVEADLLKPELLGLDIDRPPVCEQLCKDCNVYCKSYCYQETDIIYYTYTFDYVCCNEQNIAIINIYDNGTLIHSNSLASGTFSSFEYTWVTTGLHELIIEAVTCCGTFRNVYKIYVVPCKPYDIDFDWTLDCDCNYKGSNNKVRECNCVPVGEEVLFIPEYTIPDCGCPEECETIITDPTEEDVFTEQTNGNNLSIIKANKGTFLPPSFQPQDFWFIVPPPAFSFVNFSGYSSPSFVSGGVNGIVANFILNSIEPPIPNLDIPVFLFYTFQNPYPFLPSENYRLEFVVQFRYQNTPFPISYPNYGQVPEFPFKEIFPFAYNNTLSPAPNTNSTKITYNPLGFSEYNHHLGLFTVPFRTSFSPAPQEPFTNALITAYQIVVEGNSLGASIDTIGLHMLLNTDLFLNNQYIFEIMVSDISLYKITQGTEQERCFKKYVVEWFVDDNKVKSIDMTIPNYELKDDRLEHAFFDKGCHKVRLEVSNCAGMCSQEHEVCAGDSITLSKDECYEWKIEDCKKYEQCYINGNVEFPYDHTTLNIVTLPVDTEWIQLEQDKLYYDERENKHFVYNNASPLIIPYADLYNASLSHYSFIGIINYPYVHFLNQNALIICKEYKATIELYDINNNLIVGYPYEIYPYYGQNIFLSIHKDGIYKVKFRVYSKLPLTNVFSELECEYEWYLIELCGIYKCYEGLFEKLQCATDCECPDEKEIAKLREKINRFMAFFNLLNLGIEGEFTQYSTMNSIVLDQMSLAKNIDEQINALIKLCNECGCPCKQTAPSKPYCSDRILSGKQHSSLYKGYLSSKKCPCEK